MFLRCVLTLLLAGGVLLSAAQRGAGPGRQRPTKPEGKGADNQSRRKAGPGRAVTQTKTQPGGQDPAQLQGSSSGGTGQAQPGAAQPATGAGRAVAQPKAQQRGQDPAQLQGSSSGSAGQPAQLQKPGQAPTGRSPAQPNPSRKP